MSTTETTAGYKATVNILLHVEIGTVIASVVMLSLAVLSGLRANICRLQYLRAVFVYFCWSLLYALAQLIRSAAGLYTHTLPKLHLFCAIELLSATGFYAKLLAVTYIAWLTRYDLK